MSIPRHEHLFSLPETWQQYLVKNALHDENTKNIYLATVLFNIMLTTIPCAALLYLMADDSMLNVYMHGIGLFYTICNLTTWAKSFILCMHYSTHVPIFIKRGHWQIFNYILPFFICTFFGVLPGQYYLHHVVMHHKENNIFPCDLSATMHYQRDNRWHMYHYCMRYIFGIYIELPYYAFKKERYDLFLRSVGCVILSVVVLYSLFCWRPIPTIYVFILPLFIIGYGLMEGNFSQHIFVDPNVLNLSPDELPYGITYTCIESKNNSYTFNDGYHVEHHAIPGTPWYDLPEKYDIQKYKKYDGIAFKEIDIDKVREYVFSQNYDKLSDYYINHKNRSRDEIVKLLKSRVNAIRIDYNKM